MNRKGQHVPRTKVTRLSRMVDLSPTTSLNIDYFCIRITEEPWLTLFSQTHIRHVLLDVSTALEGLHCSLLELGYFGNKSIGTSESVEWAWRRVMPMHPGTRSDVTSETE